MPPETNPQAPAEPVQTPETHPDANPTMEKAFQEAAKLLEYEAPPEPAPEPPEEPTEPPEEPAPEPEVKAAPPPEPEPPAEPEKPKKSKRELFKERADSEKAHRDKESKLKEREAALLEREQSLKALELEFSQFKANPYEYLEKQNPKFYEELTARYASGEMKKPEVSPEVAELRAQLEAVKKELLGKHEETEQKVSRAEYVQYMADAQGILTGTEFAPVREAGELMEKLNGQKPNLEAVIAGVWAEYHQQYQQTLTPAEVCEIILEDAQAYLERVKPLLRAEEPAENPPKKKTSRRPARTTTNEQETQSLPARGPDLSKTTNREAMIAEAAKLLEYEDEE